MQSSISSAVMRGAWQSAGLRVLAVVLFVTGLPVALGDTSNLGTWGWDCALNSDSAAVVGMRIGWC